MKNKIVLIAPGTLPVPAVMGGAVETLIQALIDKNEKLQKFEFLVFSPDVKEARDYSKIYNHTRFVFVPNKKRKSVFLKIKNEFYRFLRYFGIEKYIKNEYISNVIKTMENYGFDGIILENRPEYSIPLKKQFPTIPIFAHLHNKKLYPKCRYERKMIESIDAYFCVSEYICRETCSVLGVSKNNVFCCYNGIDSECFSKQISFEDFVKLRTKFGLKTNDFVFIFSGRIVPEKGIGVLLEAFLNVEKKLPNVKLLILGATGFQGSSINWEHENISSNIIFSGYIPYDKMSSMLKLGDVAVLPSIWDDPFPLSLLEVLCAGLPTIITDSGGMPEAVKMDAAEIVPRGNDLATRLAEKMFELYTDCQKRNLLKESAVIRGKFFSQERFFSRFCELVNFNLNKNAYEK